jgi:exodeoxyribonuclease VII large subunit
MGKTVTTQWDFGELFPKEQARKILSVTELTSQIRRLLEKQVGQVWVTGEVTNLRVQSSGHSYFTLKDASAQLGCVLFRGEVQVDRALVEDGRKLNVYGEITVYEPRGQYQMRVTAVELQGVGALQAAFEKLKQKLNAEGLFAPERKRPLPRFPQRIGLVTSPTGAAIRDVLHVIERRDPSLQIILAPCRVQGEGASQEIARAIRLLNELHVHQNLSKVADEPATAAQGQLSVTQVVRVFNMRLHLDLILVTRGGGSLEDLWAFNEEIVARAIFESALPVVSAVGHEIDFTISDFVADLRAATPSAAAEIITEGVFSSCQFLAAARNRIRQLTGQRMADKHYKIAQIAQRLTRLHPRRRLNDWLQQLDDLQSSLLRCLKQNARHRRMVWENLLARLSRVRPEMVLRQRREVLSLAQQRLHEQVRHRTREFKNRLALLQSRLQLLGPEQVLARGYSITTDPESGKVFRDADEIQPGQRLKTKLKKGQVTSRAD